MTLLERKSLKMFKSKVPRKRKICSLEKNNTGLIQNRKIKKDKM